MLSTYDGYRYYARDLAGGVARVARQGAVQRDTAHYRAAIAGVKTVDDFLKDGRLYTYAMTSFGLEDAIPNRGFMRKVLTSDLSDPKSFANTQNDKRYRDMAAAYAFGEDGKVVSTAAAQDAAQEDETLGLYTRQSFGPATQADDVAYYKSHIGRVTSVQGFEGDPRLLRVALEAYGIDPATIPTAEVTRLLEGAPVDPGDAVPAQGARPDIAGFEAAFNFDGAGKVTSPRLAQSARGTATTLAAFKAAASSAGVGRSEADADASYYAASIGKVRTLGDFLSDSRLISVATAAAGVARPAGLTDAAWTARLRSALTSDLADPKNAAAALGAPYAKLAAAFDFTGTGGIARVPAQRAQSAAAADLLAGDHANQIMEDQAGAADPGVKLALYFRRQAPKLTSPYGILADKGLLSVVETALGLPENFSRVDVDAQARMLGRKVKLADFADPAKLDAFVRRFAVLYDAAKAKATPPATPLDAATGGTVAGASTLLAAVHPAPTATDRSGLLQLFTRS